MQPLDLQGRKVPNFKDLIHMAMAKLSMSIMLAQSTPFSYHTGGLVKKEVTSTAVLKSIFSLEWCTNVVFILLKFCSMLSFANGRFHKLLFFSQS